MRFTREPDAHGREQQPPRPQARQPMRPAVALSGAAASSLLPCPTGMTDSHQQHHHQASAAPSSPSPSPQPSLLLRRVLSPPLIAKARLHHLGTFRQPPPKPAPRLHQAAVLTSFRPTDPRGLPSHQMHAVFVLCLPTLSLSLLPQTHPVQCSASHELSLLFRRDLSISLCWREARRRAHASEPASTSPASILPPGALVAKPVSVIRFLKEPL